MPESNRTFSTSWDKRVKTVSGLVTLVLVGVLLETFARLDRFSSQIIALRIGLVVLIGITSISWFIRGYTITSDSILINHPGWTTKLDLKKLSSASRVPVGAYAGIGLFGVWGAYSVTGIAYSSTYGLHRRYLTNRWNSVVLKFGDKVVLVSPDNPDEFIGLLQGSKPIENVRIT